MTGRERHRTGPEAPPAPSLTVTLLPGTDTREDWCTACKAYTRLTGTVLILTPNGVATAGDWAWCEICDDPTDQGGPARV